MPRVVPFAVLALAFTVPRISLAPLLLGLLIVVVLELSVWASERWARSDVPSAIIAAGTRFVRHLQLGSVIACAGFAVLSTFSLGRVRLIGFVLLVSGVTFSTGANQFGRTLDELKRQGVPQVQGWTRYGYVNRKDPRAAVPKLYGLGYALNLGNPKGRQVIGSLVVIAVLTLLLPLLHR